MEEKITFLNKKILTCTKCKRLVNFRQKIAKEKTRRFRDENYWGKPVIGFGDKKAKIIILGLALRLMVQIELEECLQEINPQNFYLDACIKLKWPINPIQII